MLQERTEDDWRGRVFATDFLLMTTVNGTSSLIAALMIAYVGIDLRTLVLIFAVGQTISGVLWLSVMLPGERRYFAENQASIGTRA